MDTKEYEPKKYHQLVWKTAKQDTEIYFRSDRWAWIGGAISAVVSAALATYAQYVLTMASMIPLWISLLIIAVTTILGLASFVVVLWGWNVLWLVPAKKYQELKIEANKRSWRDVEIKPFHFPENNQLGVGLEVVSNKPDQFKITQVYCLIYEITHSYDVEFRGNMQLPLLSFPSLQRTTEIINKTQTTKLNSGQIMAVANSDGSKAWIEKNDALTDYAIESNILHKLTIGVDGILEHVGTMDRCLLYCDLLYKKNEQTGKMELSLKITDRNQQYEN